MDIEQLKHKIMLGWSPRTSTDPERWARRGPAWGQGAVTALYVQQLFGGEIVRATYETPAEIKGEHYFNVLPDGAKLDLTAQQFPESTVFDPPAHRSGMTYHLETEVYLKETQRFDGSMREYLLASPDIHARYERFCTNIEKFSARAR